MTLTEESSTIMSVFPHVLSSPVIPTDRSQLPGRVVPPPGPIWYPSVMGTGILSTLLGLHAQRLPGAAYASFVMLIVCWVLIIGLTTTFLLRCLRGGGVLKDSLTNPAIVPFWGTVSMGFLSAGSALTVALPLHFPDLVDFAWGVNTYMWAIGAFIGIVSAVTFTIRAYGSSLGQPTFVWGLAVVGPMVAATAGANLSSHVDPSFGPVVLLLASMGFVVTLTLAGTVFIHAYIRTWSVAPLPLPASASSWIPLGLVGQSAAAAQAAAFNVESFAQGSLIDAAHSLANVYGWLMFVIGTPLTLWACVVTIRGVMNRMPFSPGWWGTTFPIGTLSLGATFMARGTELPFLSWVGALGTLALVGTVTFSAVGSLVAIGRVFRG